MADPKKSDGKFAIEVNERVLELTKFLDANKSSRQFTIKNMENIKWLIHVAGGVILKYERKLEMQSLGGKFKG